MKNIHVLMDQQTQELSSKINSIKEGLILIAIRKTGMSKDNFMLHHYLEERLHSRFPFDITYAVRSKHRGRRILAQQRVKIQDESDDSTF
jgi:hypothetical protein